METLADNTSINVIVQNNSVNSSVDSDMSFTSDGHNSSKASTIYSAEEQIIRQRGRRSSQLKSNNATTNGSKTTNNIKNNGTSHIEPLQPHNRTKHSTQIKDLKQSLSARRRSLLRTPVKKRLKRHASILSQVRQSNRRRPG